MEALNLSIMAVSIIICLILFFYLLSWSLRKRVKPIYVKRNVLTFAWVQALVLETALLLNCVVMDFRGIKTEFDDYYAIIPIVISVLLGLMCREVLLKNYKKYIHIGDKCNFVVASVGERRLQGYVVIGNNNWLPAEAIIAPEEAEKYFEEQQMTAVICDRDPDNKFLIVEV